MFEIVDWFHRAFKTDSTWAFVAFVAVVLGLFFGALAFIVDKSHKNAKEEDRRRLYSGDFPIEESALDKMRAALSGTQTKPPHNVLITVYGEGEKRKLAQQLQRIFSEAGWGTGSGGGGGEGHGVRVLVTDKTPIEGGLVEGALAKAGIPFNVYRVPSDYAGDVVVVQIGEAH